MTKKKFLKGSPLFALARSKACSLNIETAGLKLEPLIREVQAAEGHEPCFREKKTLPSDPMLLAGLLRGRDGWLNIG
jgi:hypothetical protein